MGIICIYLALISSSIVVHAGAVILFRGSWGDVRTSGADWGKGNRQDGFASMATQEFGGLEWPNSEYE